MRLRPPLLALIVVTAAVVVGASVLHWTGGGTAATDGGATVRDDAEPAAAAGATSAVKPIRDVPQLALPDPLPNRTLKVPILMYHRIAVLQGDEPAVTQGLTVDPGEFRLQVQWLKEHGYETITQQQLFEALEQGGSLPDRPVMLTFDDGYRAVATIAAPIMSKVGFTGTAYVITDRIATDPKRAPTWLTWAQLRILEQRGWDIGSHTVSHTEIPQLGEAAALKTLRASRFALERRLGHPVQWFCYPAGAVDQNAVDWVAKAGYVLATTTQSGDVQRAADPLRLSRIRVSNTTGVRGLAAALS